MFKSCRTHREAHRGHWLLRRRQQAPERFFDPEFPEFLQFVATFRTKRRPRILDKLSQLDGTQRVITLASPRAVSRFLAEL